MTNQVLLFFVALFIFEQSYSQESVSIDDPSENLKDSSQVILHFKSAIRSLNENPIIAKGEIAKGLELYKTIDEKPQSVNDLDFQYLIYEMAIDNGEFEKANSLIDSIEVNIENATKKDRLHVRLYASRGDIKIKQGDKDNGLDYFYQALNLAKNYNSYILQGMVHTKLAIIHDTNEQKDSALFHMIQSSQFTERSNSPKKNIAVIFDYINIGILYDENGSKDAAIKYYDKIIARKDSIRLKAIPATALKNKAIISKSRGKDSIALEYLNEAEILAESIASKTLFFDVVNEKGKIYKKLDQQERAVTSFESALAYFQEINQSDYIFRTNLFLSECYLDTDKAKSNYYFQKSAELWEEISLKEKDKQVELYAETAYRLGRPESALEAYRLQIKNMQDEFTNEKSLAALDLQTKYEAELGAKEKSLRIQNLEDQNRWNIILGILISLIVVALAIGLYQFFSVKKQRSFNHILQNRKQELERINEELQESNTELERFAYIASHDLKTPLATIRGFTSLIEKELKQKSYDKIEQFNNIIKSSSERMNQLIVNVLEYSRISKNSDESLKEMINLKDIFLDLEKSFFNIPDDKVFKINLRTDLPIVEGNRVRFYNAFQNLVANGLKYNTSQIPTIEVNHEVDDSHLNIYVKDNGIGISREQWGNVFVMFNRLHNNDKYEGTGLGLSICAKILSKENGSISVHESNGNGTVFKIILPVSVIQAN